MFVTNNATKSRKNYKKKFDDLNIEAHVVGKLIDIALISLRTSIRMRYMALPMLRPCIFHR